MRIPILLAALLVSTAALPAQKLPDKLAEKTPVVYREIKFVGVKHVPIAALRRVAAAYEGKLSAGTEADVELVERVRDVYQQHGYFKAQIVSETPPQDNSGEQNLTITYKVEEGRQYRLKTIKFQNGKAFQPTVLRAAFPIRAGEIFNTAKIRLGLENLRRLYTGEGYLNFTPVPDTVVDDDKGTVSLSIDVDEDKQYRVATLKIFGLDWDRTTKLLCGWPVKPGMIYRSEAIESFFTRNQAWLPPGSTPVVNLERRMNEKSGTVDVFLNFSDIDAPTVEVQAKNPNIEFSTEKPRI